MIRILLTPAMIAVYHSRGGRNNPSRGLCMLIHAPPVYEADVEKYFHRRLIQRVPAR